MKITTFLVPELFSVAMALAGTVAPAAEFGDNTSQYANDGECDDRRFIGMGMASGLDVDDNYHDANDCRKLYNAGMIKLVSEAAGRAATQCDAIEFGDNSSEWANDGECDDPRFDGSGVDSIVLMSDLLADARDCRGECRKGTIWLRTAGDEQVVDSTPAKPAFDVSQCDAIDYGTNTSTWANDGECDDPRFEGPGVDGIVLDDDLMVDADDCRAQCLAGNARLRQ